MIKYGKYIYLIVFYLSACFFNGHLWTLTSFSTFYQFVGMAGTWGFLSLWYVVVYDKLQEHEEARDE